MRQKAATAEYTMSAIPQSSLRPLFVVLKRAFTHHDKAKYNGAIPAVNAN